MAAKKKGAKIDLRLVNHNDYFVLVAGEMPGIYVESDFMKRMRLVRHGIGFCGRDGHKKMRELSDFLKLMADFYEAIDKKREEKGSSYNDALADLIADKNPALEKILQHVSTREEKEADERKAVGDQTKKKVRPDKAAKARA